MVVELGGGGEGVKGGGFLLSCIPARVNYLLFALDKPEARFPPCNESSESQGRLVQEENGGGNKIKQRRCHYHIISPRSIMNETHIKWRGSLGKGGSKEFMEMTCVERLNYNYYYLAFDVVRESNYKMLGGGGG